MKLHNQLALCQVVIKMKAKTYNEWIFESFERSSKDGQKKGGEKDVKLNRIKKKLWCGRRQLPKLKRELHGC